VLHDLIMAARDREHEATDTVDRHAWLGVRAAAHEALAQRQSRVALHDIRESLEHATGPLPRAFLHALETIGDVSCLEALARAWETSHSEPSWKLQLQQTALAVMRANKATGRHTAVKRVRARWPGFLQ
jgi:HEAT repeat protein